MSVDERTRHEIHGRFEELLGPELAGAFMSYLPPVGWADVATKRDLDALGARLDAAAVLTKRDLDALGARLDATAVATTRDLTALEARFEARLEATIHREVGGLRTEMTDRIDRAIRLNVFTNIATMVTLTGLVLAVTQLG